jgi:hypothetical protein
MASYHTEREAECPECGRDFIAAGQQIYCSRRCKEAHAITPTSKRVPPGSQNGFESLEQRIHSIWDAAGDGINEIVPHFTRDTFVTHDKGNTRISCDGTARIYPDPGGVRFVRIQQARLLRRRKR